MTKLFILLSFALACHGESGTCFQRTLELTRTSMTSLPEGYRAVVIGAGGGIGSAVAAALGADERCGALYALSRTGLGGPDAAVKLAAGVTDAASLTAAAAQIGADGPIDLIFIASGLLHRDTAVQPEKSWRQIAPDPFAEVFAVNATGPMLALTALLPLVPRDRRVLIGAVGARVGSIGDNRLGGWYAYRASKAALAMLLRTLSIELARTHPQLAVLMLHPGTVDTPLSEPFQRGVAKLLTPEESAAAMLGVLDSAPVAWSGEQRDWQGELVVP
jgi:NAD(P)-dependent dehydrogenase (short-subunit alcohol dehydrogenase family)